MTETITARSVVESVDEVTLVTTTVVVTHYTGRARFRFAGTAAADRDAGGQQFADSDAIVSVPVGTTRIPTDALIVVDASTADSLLVGLEARVKAVPASGQVTANRYPVEVLS